MRQCSDGFVHRNPAMVEDFLELGGGFDGYCLKTTGGPLIRFPGEIDGYLYTVSNFDERNAAVHAVLLSVECHCPFDGPAPFPSRGTVSVSLSCLVTPRIVKSPSSVTVSGPVCSTFVE